MNASSKPAPDAAAAGAQPETKRTDASLAPGAQTHLARAVWLPPRLLLLLGRLPFGEAASLPAAAGETQLTAQVRMLPDASLDEPLLPGGGAALAVCRFGPVGAESEGLDVWLPDAAVRIGEPPAGMNLPRDTSDLATLLREHLAGLRPGTREAIIDFLVDACGGDLAGDGGAELARELASVREGLREHLRLSFNRDDDPCGVGVDHLLAIDERSFWVSGWFRDDARTTRILGVSPEGLRVDLLEGAYRQRRADIERSYPEDRGFEHGFVNFVELPRPSLVPSGWLAELRNDAGLALEFECPRVVADPVAVRDAIMLDLGAGKVGRPKESLFADYAYPALSKVQGKLRDRVRVATEIQYGAAPESPEVSIVVPLYGRVDLLEHQLAAFVRDPELREAELIYVLDSPELDFALAGSSAELHKLYGVPFKVLTLTENAGFANATNIGAKAARGHLLLLLNSDVLPERPGWLSRMAAFYDATEGIGALAPKLLFEDDSLQHAGIYFQDLSLEWEGIEYSRETGAPLFENAHYFKGLHRDLPAANIARPVPAVTGACLMIDRAMYEELGGLRDVFIQGGYEDTDLCLRLREHGRQSWYLPNVALYHLEDQSFPSTVRALALRFNIWLHSHLWRDQIQAAMREQDATSAHAVA